jgi:hypothetical protein
MSGWVHVERDSAGMCLMLNPDESWCSCTTPTPDPSSPCGWRGRDGTWEIPCRNGGTLHEGLLHPHQPTRCTCGHPIEERA